MGGRVCGWPPPLVVVVVVVVVMAAIESEVGDGWCWV
jgi:hypothetical protein